MPNCSQPKFHVTNAIPWWFTSGHDEPRCVVRRDSIHPRHFWPPAHRTYPPYRHWTPTNSSAQQSQTYFFRPLIARLRWRRQRGGEGTRFKCTECSWVPPLSAHSRGALLRQYLLPREGLALLSLLTKWFFLSDFETPPSTHPIQNKVKPLNL